MSRTLLLTSLLTLLIAPACVIVIDKTGGEGESEPHPGTGPEPEPIDDTGTACTDIAYASVLVHTVGPDGLPVRATSVTWSTGTEESPMPAECMDEDCTTLIAGWEVSGDITISASLQLDTEDPCCWLVDNQSATVNVPETEDGCHVITQDLTIMLTPEDMVCADGECG